MTGTTIVCSGQGVRSAGMFGLLADAPEAAPVFEAAKAILDGRDPRGLVHQASDQDSHTNHLRQILCFNQTMAAWTVIRGRLSGPLVVAGYSLGELGAWGVAGFMDAAEVLRLAVLRAAAMDAATTRPSGLAAIRGLERDVLDRICTARGTYVAIINAGDQMLVGEPGKRWSASSRKRRRCRAIGDRRDPGPCQGDWKHKMQKFNSINDEIDVDLDRLSGRSRPP